MELIFIYGKTKVSKKPYTLSYVLTLKDVSLYSYFTINLAFLDVILAPFCLYITLNSFLQFFKELNKINHNISAYKVQLTNAERQVNQENKNEFKNDSNKTRKK